MTTKTDRKPARKRQPKDSSGTKVERKDSILPESAVAPNKDAKGDKANEQVFVLPESITIDNIEALHSQILQFSTPSGEPIIFDASRTEIITTPGIQLFIAVAKAAAHAGCPMVIKQHKEAFEQSFAVLGLSSRLTEWEESRWLKKS